MAYCTQEDLLALIPEREMAELSAETGSTPDAAVVAEVIAAADAEIDAYLAVRYILPLASTPPQIKSLSRIIAIYHLYYRRGVVAEARRQAYRDAVAFLQQVRDGKAQVVGLDGAEPPGDAGTVVEISSQDRVFDRDKLSGW